MRIRPATREIIVLLIILLGFLFFLVQFQFTFRSSSFSGSVYQLGVKLKLAHSRPKYAAYEGEIAPGSGELARVNQTLSTRVRWETGEAPKTSIVAHAPGWTIFDRLYVHQGTVYIVTDDPKSVPPLHEITSAGHPILKGPEEAKHRMPTNQHIQVISPEDADQKFRKTALWLEGVTFLVNEPPQFLAHYYHFSAELMLGLWRTYSSLDPNITSSGQTNLPPPRRLVFPNVESKKWRDYASMNQYIIRSVFPSVVMEFERDWKAWSLPPHNTLLYDRVVFSDRAAAMHGNMTKQTQRIAAGAMELEASPHWWTTVRAALIKFAGHNPGQHSQTPVITYVSRQGWGRRMLRQADHEKLVAALYDLQKKHGYEVNVVSLDKMPRAEQIKLAARTTVMMGVHGNGLTSLIWMTPTLRSTVIEFFCPPGFAMDYEWTARALGMVHYGFWNDQYFTSPQLPPKGYPECFQGNDIPIDGDAVARLVESRLSLDEETDD